MHRCVPHSVRFTFQSCVIIDWDAVQHSPWSNPTLTLLHYVPGLMGKVSLLTRTEMDFVGLGKSESVEVRRSLGIRVDSHVRQI